MVCLYFNVESGTIIIKIDKIVILMPTQSVIVIHNLHHFHLLMLITNQIMIQGYKIFVCVKDY